MIRYILIICFAFLGVEAFSQGAPLIIRNDGKTTALDSNLFVGKAFRPPAFLDTSAANQATRVLDSSGRVIFTRSDNSLWVRSVQRKWEKIGSDTTNWPFFRPGNNIFFTFAAPDTYTISTNAVDSGVVINLIDSISSGGLIGLTNSPEDNPPSETHLGYGIPVLDSAEQRNNVLIGANAADTINVVRSVIIGNLAASAENKSNLSDDVIIGYKNSMEDDATRSNRVAIGSNPNEKPGPANNSIAIGYNTTAPLANTVIIGDSAIDYKHGINTYYPTASLDVNGSLRIRTDSAQEGYVWTATDADGNGQWRASLGGGTLQTVTDAGDTTDNNISLNYGGVKLVEINRLGSGNATGQVTVRDNRLTTGNGKADLLPSRISWSGVNGALGGIYFANNYTASLGREHLVRVPVTSETSEGTVRNLTTSVNGTYADNTGNVTIATGVNNLQEAYDADSLAYPNIQVYDQGLVIGGGDLNDTQNTIFRVDPYVAEMSSINGTNTVSTFRVLGDSTYWDHVSDGKSIQVKLDANKMVVVPSVSLDSTDIKIGFGTTYPQQNLHVVGGAITDSLYSEQVSFDTIPTNPASVTGKLVYDTASGTLQLGLKGGNVTLQIGQEEVVRVHNKTGSTLTDGQMVFVDGSTGQLPSVALASDTAEVSSTVVLGMVTEPIPHGADGYVTVSGIVNGLNTNSYTAGDVVYLGTTPGSITNVKPTAPNHTVMVGYVIKKSGGNGSIFVKVQNGYELGELHDVKITNPQAQDVIQYDTAQDIWVNQGITLPSVTQTQMNAISNPTIGRQVFNTTYNAVCTYVNDWGWWSTDPTWLTYNGWDSRSEFITTGNNTTTTNVGDFYAQIANSGTVTSSAGLSNRPGIIQLSTASSATSRASLISDLINQQTILVGGGRLLFEADVQVSTLSSASETFRFFAGLSASAQNVSGGAIAFLYDSTGANTGSAAIGRWQVVCSNGSNRSYTTTDSTVTAGQWYRLRAVVNAAGNSVEFYINGTLVKTETNNIPAVAVSPMAVLTKSNGTTARTVLVDFIRMRQKFTTAR